MAELRELARGRADLRAEVAGIFEGASEGEKDEPSARCAAYLCRKAGGRPGGWPVAMLLVFAPLAVRQFRRKVLG